MEDHEDLSNDAEIPENPALNHRKKKYNKFYDIQIENKYFKL